MSDQVWMSIRYLLLAVGGFFAGRGYWTMDQATTVVDALPSIIGMSTAVGSAIWGLYVKWGTSAVPQATAERPDVPTINPATGATEPGTKRLKRAA